MKSSETCEKETGLGMQHRLKHVALCMPAHLIKRLEVDRLAIARVNNVRAGEEGETRKLGEENLQRRQIE